MSGEIAHKRALIGKSGEALVAAELLRKQIDVAYPAHDGGVDLIAYKGHRFSNVLPIQVKSASGRSFAFMKSWFRIQGIVLVHVWHVATAPEFYVFGESDVEDALGSQYARSDSWMIDGRYSVTNPTDIHAQRMQPHRDRWDRIESRLI
jgi:hypothetical protein